MDEHDSLKPFRSHFNGSRPDDIDKIEGLAGFIAHFYNTLVEQGVPDEHASMLTEAWMLSVLGQTKGVQ